MKTKTLLLFFLIFYNTIFSQSLELNGKEFFINGMNIPWKEFAWDFGRHPEWGIAYDGDYYERLFQDIRAAGANTVRIWIHCDGRASPEFDKNGFVTGFDEEFFEHLDDFLLRLEQAELMVIFTLWSHDLANSQGGQFITHTDLIQDKAKLESYINNALTPLINRYKDNCNILAWDIMNEPEWVMKIPFGGTTEKTVKREEMIYFIGRCAQVIHENCNQFVTVASAWALMSSNHFSSIDNFWQEDEFQKLGLPCSTSYLDYYTMHYYPYMTRWFSPFHNKLTTFGFNRPVVIGETPVNFTKGAASLDLSNLSSLEKINRSFDNGFSGILFWSYNKLDEFGGWDQAKEAIQTFAEEHDNIITTNLDCTDFSKKETIVGCRIFPNPTNNFAYFESLGDRTDLEIQLFDIRGSLLKTKSITSNSKELIELDFQDFQSGIYIVKIFYKNNGIKQFLQQQKIFIAK